MDTQHPVAAPAQTFRPKIHILDTTVLRLLLEGEDGFGRQKEESDDPNKAKYCAALRETARRLFNHKWRRILIPMNSFLETTYQFFQVNIRLEDYDLWYRHRRSVFNQRIQWSVDNDPRVELLREFPSDFGPANLILARIQDCYLDGLREIYRHRPNPGPRGVKFLDGMDAAILAEAIAAANRHPESDCFLVTQDRSLSLAVEKLGAAYDFDPLFAPPNLKPDWIRPYYPKKRPRTGEVNIRPPRPAVSAATDAGETAGSARGAEGTGTSLPAGTPETEALEPAGENTP